MSKFKQSSITPNHRGRIGGNIMSKNKYGPFMAMLTTPRQYRTEAQLKVTGDLGALSHTWSNKMIDEQYESWGQLALQFKRTDSSGNVYPLDARDVFMSCNSNLREVGLPVIFDAPRNILPHSFSSFTVEASVENNLQKLNLFIEPEIEKDTRVVIFATLHLKYAKRKFNDSWFRVIGYIDSTFKSGDSISSLYKNRLPELTPLIDGKIAFRFRSVSAISGIALPHFETFIARREKSPV